MTYVDYDIASDRVCSRLSKRELSISLTRPLLVREGGRLLGNWPGSHSFNCRWEVEAKGRGLGVVAVIQKLKFRSLDEGECLDYVKFREDNMPQPYDRICGSMLFGIQVTRDLNFLIQQPTQLPPLRPTMQSSMFSGFLSIFRGSENPWKKFVSRGAVVDPRGELKTYVYVANKALKGDYSLDLVVAYSGFQECDGLRVPSTLFHCGLGLCISRQLVNDGVVNCPFGDCIDEGSCAEAKASNLTAHILGHSTSTKDVSGVPPGIAATSSVFALTILVTIGVCICFILRRNRQQRQEQSTGGGISVYPVQGGNGDYMGVPLSSMGQMSNNGGDPLVPKPTVIPGMTVGPSAEPQLNQTVPQGGSGLPIGFTVPGTAYPSNVGTPYPCPGTGNALPYPVQPPTSMAQPQSGMPSAPMPEPPPPYSSLFPDH
ncbi:uncharacterized protein [Hetaerina americana]|uniref:uncharacterized protein n=1 Tax=Hetaerina americana TaxID=62018 RepID=UPI003A7F3892